MWKELWDHHKATIVCIAGGIFFGILYLISGFWDMLFVLLLILIGYYIGRKIDRGEPWTEFSQIYRWLTDRWNPFDKS